MNDELLSSGTVNWFALRVKTGWEKKVAASAESKGFEGFLPTYQTRRRWSDRYKTLEMPLFPGYFFCRLDPEARLPLLKIPGVHHFVGVGKIPMPIEESEIVAIERTIQSGLFAEPWPFMTVGDRVRVEYGPLAGVEGLFIEIKKQHRIVVSVSLLMRSVAVEIERDWVKPLDPPRRVA